MPASRRSASSARLRSVMSRTNPVKTGGQIVLQPAPVTLAKALGNDEGGELSAQHVLAAMLEDGLRRRVELEDPPLVVDGDDAVDRPAQDRRLLGLALLDRLQRPLAFGDIQGRHQHGAAAVEFQGMRNDVDVDHPPVLAAVAPLTGQLEPGALSCRIGGRLGRLVRVPDIADPHGQEFIAGVAVVRNGGGVDLDEFEILEVIDPHRQGIVGEHQPEGFRVVAKRHGVAAPFGVVILHTQASRLLDCPQSIAESRSRWSPGSGVERVVRAGCRARPAVRYGARVWISAGSA